MNTGQGLRTALLISLFPSAILAADTGSVDKRPCNLFDPVPQDLLRPLSAESKVGFPDALTLDAGHFQVDGDFFNGYYNRGPLTQTTSQVLYSNPGVQTIQVATRYSDSDREVIWAPRITVGLFDHLDFFVRPSYELASFEQNKTLTFSFHEITLSGTFNSTVISPVPSHKTAINSFETLTTGFKVNLWGNDGGWTAFAIRPYLAIPTSQGDVVGGGADLALLVRLPHGFTLNVDSEFYTAGDNNNYAGFGNNLSLSKALCSRFDVYGYWDSQVTTDSAETWQAYAGLGLDYNFTRNVQLFASLGLGVVPADWVFGQNRAYDYNPRAGLVWRF
jgi:hypothetical protein